MAKQRKKDDVINDEEGIKQINIVKVGEFEIHSSTAGLDKVVKSMGGWIKDYNEYSKLSTLDKLKRGIGGIG